MKLREAINNLSKNQNIIEHNDDIFLTRCDDTIVLSFNAKDAFESLSADVSDTAYEIDLNNSIFEDEMDKDNNYKLASKMHLRKLSIQQILDAGIIPSINTLKTLSSSQPVMLKVAQWGGHGGQGVDNIGQGIGVGSPMSGAVNFDNPISRVQFDQSLDMLRNNQPKSDWSQSLETRMQENDLYGHKRNDKDWNLKNYRLTYKERVKEKKKDYLQRMIDNRNNFDKMVDKNSVESIKSTPLDVNHYTSLEDKLENRRETESSTEKRIDIHGPESEFTYFPPTPKEVTAQTIVHNGLSSIFDNDPESMKNESAYPYYYSGRQRVKQFPWSMQGPTREKSPVDIGEENNLMWGGDWINGPSNNKGGTVAKDYLVDGWATEHNPGNIPDQVFTPEMLPAVIQEIKDHLKIQEVANNPKQNNQKQNTEKQLEKAHRRTPGVGVDMTNYDYQRVDDPYPYSTRNFFIPRLRLNKAGG